MPLYDRPVRILMRDMAAELDASTQNAFTRDDAVAWFSKHYPLVKPGTIAAHLIRLSTNNKNRLHYGTKLDDDVFFQLDSARFRRFDPARDPLPIHGDEDVASASPQAAPTAPSDSESEFAYEHDLRDFLARNLQLIEPGLTLYEQEGVTGVEFPAGGRFIDILAVDARGGLVIVELKVSKGYDRVIGQLLRYVGWIERHHAEPGQRVRGFIIAKSISDDLKLACSRIRDVQLMEYELAVSLRSVI